MFGTRVVSENGTDPTFGQVAGRTLSRFIPFEPLSVLFSNTHLGWHDSLSKTKVVATRKRPSSDNAVARRGGAEAARLTVSSRFVRAEAAPRRGLIQGAAA